MAHSGGFEPPTARFVAEYQIPRIGQEVIVSFLEGDPDRPIITGRVYNAEQTVPYELPANATQSGTKSRSSKGGTPANFNEIRMEDKKGAEQLYRPVTPGVAGSSPVRCAIHFPSRVHHPELAVFHQKAGSLAATRGSRFTGHLAQPTRSGSSVG